MARLREAVAREHPAPVTVQLRYLQTLREVAAENNSTTIFPVPIDLLTASGTGAMEAAIATIAVGAFCPICW